MSGKPLNEWFEIPGTAGAGGAAATAFSGLAIDERTSTVVIAAAGGHTDSADNRVVSLQLSVDAPSWVVRKTSSGSFAVNVAYYSDGTPTSRHLYHSSHVVESLDRVFLFGTRAAYGGAYDFPVVDAFNLSTNQWDPAGTWPSIPSGGNFGAVKVRATGDVYTTTLFKWTAQTNTWSQPIVSRTSDAIRWPIAHDSLRNQLFSLEWGDGQGFGQPSVSATRVPLSGSTQFTVMFNSSPALTQFQADSPTYAGMDYDADNDRFLFYCGQGSGAGRIYVIKPNGTNVWDMSLLSLGGNSVVPQSVDGAGVLSRFRYVPALKGFLLLGPRQANMYFIRTA
jgi:hypothetical protein